jgi:hypothetical protein
MMEGIPMLFSSNRGRMQRKSCAARKVRRRSGSWPSAGCKPMVDCLEARTLPSLFAPAVNYPTGNSPTFVATGDINGDSKLDLVVTNRDSNTVSVLLGNGNGTFQPRLNTGTGALPNGVAVDDFNADGKLDLAVPLYGEGKVSILLGNGNGTFHAGASMSTGVQPDHVAVGDFNGDTKTDLAVPNALSDSLSVLLGNGDGTFKPAVNYHVGDSPVSVSIGDFNSDGKLDLATPSQNSLDVNVLLGNGDGTFQAPVNYPAGPAPVQSTTPADLNHDGKLDLVVPNRDITGGVSGVSVLLGKGDGTFQKRVEYPVDRNPQHVAIADFNGDGNPDIATANLDTNNLGVLLGNGDGTFQAASYYAADTGPISVVAGDFNDDGAPDVAVANVSTGNISVFLNTSSTTLPSLSIADASVKENPLGTRYVTFDVTLSAASDQAVTVHVGTAAGTATPGIDYVGKAATKTFLPGQTTQHFRVHILNDQPTGQNEQFFVNLDNATNATIADGQAVGTILESGGGAPAPRGNRSASGSSDSQSAALALAHAQGALHASFVASRSAPGGPMATVPYGPAPHGVDSVGRAGMQPVLPGQTAPLRIGSHTALFDRHAADSLFATDDGVTGF